MATPADAAALSQIHAETWEDTYVSHVPDALAHERIAKARERDWAEYSELRTRSGGGVVVLIHDQSAVGFCEFGPTEDADDNPQRVGHTEQPAGRQRRSGGSVQCGPGHRRRELLMDREGLRPVERAVLRLADEGMTSSEIAWRFRRSPGHIERVLDLSHLPRPAAPPPPDDEPVLRAVERIVVRARENGSPLTETAARLRRTPGFVARVEELARYKLRVAEAASG